jgi:hypothetical protein
LAFLNQIRLKIALPDRLGWQQVDLVIRRNDQRDKPLASLAHASGFRL